MTWCVNTSLFIKFYPLTFTVYGSWWTFFSDLISVVACSRFSFSQGTDTFLSHPPVWEVSSIHSLDSSEILWGARLFFLCEWNILSYPPPPRKQFHIHLTFIVGLSAYSEVTKWAVVFLILMRYPWPGKIKNQPNTKCPLLHFWCEGWCCPSPQSVFNIICICKILG